MASNKLDNPNRIEGLRSKIDKKAGLNSFYNKCYSFVKENLPTSQDYVIEIGSGGGFLKKIVPQVITSDIIFYNDIDVKLDAHSLPYPDNSLDGLVLINSFHHLSDVENFLDEAQRCLRQGGKVIMIEPYPGYIGYPIYRFLHHEDIDLKTQTWEFESSSPLGDANNGLAWLVFERDAEIFDQKFSQFKVKVFKPCFPTLYWLSGGLKNWTLVPSFLVNAVIWFDDILIKLAPKTGSFVKIVIEKT